MLLDFDNYCRFFSYGVCSNQKIKKNVFLMKEQRADVCDVVVERKYVEGLDVKLKGM